jgi:hypothetical protein
VNNFGDIILKIFNNNENFIHYLDATTAEPIPTGSGAAGYFAILIVKVYKFSHSLQDSSVLEAFLF